MPVRDALSRLAAEGAVNIRSKLAVMVVPMTPARFDDIMRCRLLLKPDAAIDALHYMEAARQRAIRRADVATPHALLTRHTRPEQRRVRQEGGRAVHAWGVAC